LKNTLVALCDPPGLDRLPEHQEGSPPFGGAFVSTPSFSLLRRSLITRGPVAAIPSAWPASGATPVVAHFLREEPQEPMLPGLGLLFRYPQSVVEKVFIGKVQR
nr:hypothetical protein [Tanacetum cinerariifolium]